uniref:Cyclic nucleotide-binding domain-containing protein n=1 Tax=Kalanchoe fedtschenkoi TaxID=63787 RepID=A0A7N0T9D4_KALFE
MLLSGNQYEKNGGAWGYVILLYVIMQVARAVVVVVLYPILIHLGYGMNWKEATVIVWSGLRGAVSLSMALSVNHASNDLHHLKSQIGTSFLFFTGGTVFLTLVVNGSSAQFLLSIFGMDKMTGKERCILDLTKRRMFKKTQNECEALLGDHGEDVDWSTVKGYMNCVKFLESSRPHQENVLEIDDVMSKIGLKDTRVRFLNVLRASYLRMLNEGKINWTTANALIRSIDEATDLASLGVLCDWEILKSQIQFPRYIGYLQSTPCMQKLAINLAAKRLQSACHTSVAFVEGHKIARSLLVEFLGDIEVTSAVINESVAEEKEAGQFLEGFHVTFPQVLRVIKSSEVAYKLLNDLCDYVETMDKHGLLEEKVAVHLRDIVQTDMKKLSRRPPSLEIPEARDVINLHHLLGTLTSRVRKNLESSMRPSIVPCHTLLCGKGCMPNGIWLIQNGVVKCDAKISPNKNSSHLTLSQGTIVGLYEVLAQNPCIYDVSTDTVVFCYLIEAKKFLSVLGTNLGVEELFWKESLFVISRLMLSLTFERRRMQEFRTSVGESLVMHTRVAGDVLQITNGSIGVLLQGSVRSQDAPGRTIASPALLLSSHSGNVVLTVETSGVAESSFCHFGSEYQIETSKARIGVFDISTLESFRAQSPAVDTNLM